MSSTKSAVINLIINYDNGMNNNKNNEYYYYYC